MRAGIILLLGALGCSGTSLVDGVDLGADAGVDLGADLGVDLGADLGPLDAGEIAEDTGTSTTGFEALVARYDLLETVAGAGLFREDGINGWSASDEGGPATAAELSRPHIALADQAGNIYIADKNAHAIRRVSTDGLITTVAGTNQPGDDGDMPGPATAMRLSSPNGLWVRADGTLYIYDLGNDKVRRVDLNGEMTTMFRVGGSGSGRGLWVREDEQLAYISAGAQLKRWTPNEGVTVLADGFVSLGNLHVSSDGVLRAADRGGHAVYRFDPGRAPVRIAGNLRTEGGGEGSLATETGLDQVRGVWGHPEGGFFVCTHKGGQVWFVDAEGIIRRFVDGDTEHTHAGDGAHFMTPGPKISEPRAVTMSPQGELLITENDFGYVRVVRFRQ